MTQLSIAAQYEDIQSIIKDRSFAPASALPPIWQSLARMRGTTNLSDRARADYVDVARVFAANPKMQKVMVALGHDFDRDRYPDIAALQAKAADSFQTRGLAALAELFRTFSYEMPASFYQLLAELVMNHQQGKHTKLFRNDATMDRDCLWDAVIHSVQLCGPLGLYMQSVFSKQNLTFNHLVMCSCIVIETKNPAFTITLEKGLIPVYMQNVIAGIFKQYEG